MSNDKPDFDVAAGHRRFAADCFNRAWDLIDKPSRSPEEDIEMLAASFASLWHWKHREDCSPTKLSVSHWQLSRIYALLGELAAAERHGRLSLDYASRPDTPAFYRAYAHEALARCAALAQNWPEAERSLAEARREGEQIEKESSKAMLLQDLATIPSAPA